jgi:hypothetical protein
MWKLLLHGELWSELLLQLHPTFWEFPVPFQIEILGPYLKPICLLSSHCRVCNLPIAIIRGKGGHTLAEAGI